MSDTVPAPRSSSSSDAARALVDQALDPAVPLPRRRIVLTAAAVLAVLDLADAVRSLRS